MNDRSDQEDRAACNCEGCKVVRKALKLLDDIAVRPTTMGMDDIEDLCKARELLAKEVGSVYNEEANRYERKRS